MNPPQLLALMMALSTMCASGFSVKRQHRAPLLYPAHHDNPAMLNLELKPAPRRIQQHPLWQPERTFEPAAKRVHGTKK